MSCGVTKAPVDMREACPICGEQSEYVAPETVHNGVGLVPVEPPSWICSTHGRWGDSLHGELVVQFPDALGAPDLDAVLQYLDEEPLF